MPQARAKIGLKEIALEAGVSVSAASMALANHRGISLATRERVWEISRRLGYRQPARGNGGGGLHAGRRLRRVALVALAQGVHRPTSGVFFTQLTAMVSRLELRFETACCEGDPQEQDRLLDRLVGEDPSVGVILHGLAGERLVERLVATRTPSVMLGDTLPDPPIDVVSFDYIAAGRQAASHLLAQGHSRVGFLCDRFVMRGHNSAWLDGVRLAHADAGLAVGPGLVQATGVTDGGLEKVPRSFLSGDKAPTAYVVANHVLAEALAAALRGAGRSAPICAARILEVETGAMGDNPAVVYPLETLCRQALERLMDRADHPEQQPRRIIVPFETRNIHRTDSVGPASAKASP